MIVDKLIDNSADVNIQNNDGNVPLHIALARGKIQDHRCIVNILFHSIQKIIKKNC